MLSAHGYTCPGAASHLFRTEPSTGQRWIDLLGLHTVVVEDGEHLENWTSAATEDWRRIERSRGFAVFGRTGPATESGRVTAILGEAEVRPLKVGDQEQSYTVRAPSGATLIFRDLFWPGYQAQLDGRPVEVTSFRETLTAVRLPPGAGGTLTVRYEPLDWGLAGGCLAAGVMLLLIALVLTRRRLSGSGPRLPTGGSAPDTAAEATRDTHRTTRRGNPLTGSSPNQGTPKTPTTWDAGRDGHRDTS